MIIESKDNVEVSTRRACINTRNDCKAMLEGHTVFIAGDPTKNRRCLYMWRKRHDIKGLTIKTARKDGVVGIVASLKSSI